jgi:type I restriction enzyme M protein
MGKLGREMAIETNKPITLRQLEEHLWAAADIFRNKVSNQKDYILALLFFKRASDLYAEELANAVAELGPISGVEAIARDPRFHTLNVPEGASWQDVYETDRNELGPALNDALRAIGRANPNQLSGVFENTDFNNRRALPADNLVEVVDHFNRLGDLASRRVPADMLGQAYEWLIARFAASAGKGGGEFYTPAEVGRLLAGLLDPEPGDAIYDPTCGSGGLLLAMLQRATAMGVNPRSVRLYGQELNPETWAIARMNMLLHEAGDVADIAYGDTLASPAFLDGAHLRTFDLVIANPPFSPKNWGHERLKASGDPFGRIKHLPSKSHGEMAFVQHMVASLADGGRLAVVLPNGVFFRGGEELAARRELIIDDVIECIIQLPSDMFYGSAIPACIAVCNRKKPADRRNKVLFIDASDGFERRDTKNVLTPEAIAAVANTYHEGSVLPGFAVWSTADAIADLGFNLTVRRYVGSDVSDHEPVVLSEAICLLRESVKKSHDADERALKLLAGLERDGDQ